MISPLSMNLCKYLVSDLALSGTVGVLWNKIAQNCNICNQLVFYLCQNTFSSPMANNWVKGFAHDPAHKEK